MNKENPLKMLAPPTEQWEEKKRKLEAKAKEAEGSLKLKTPKSLPKIPGITKETKKNLKFKSLWYMLAHDKNFSILKNVFKRPLKYPFNFLKSCFQKKSYSRKEDLFFYGLKNKEDFSKVLSQENTLLVVGFSYCHKPLECPSKRFNDQCINSSSSPVCQQCFISKTLNLLPKNKVIPLIIPTVHYIGNAVFDIAHKYPDKQILFIITACEMTLEMFGDWGNMVDIKGIGIRLDGRICNTMKAFELSEIGIKPGLTVVLPQTQQVILDLIKKAYERFA
jgi:hypothetical protein